MLLDVNAKVLLEGVGVEDAEVALAQAEVHIERAGLHLRPHPRAASRDLGHLGEHRRHEVGRLRRVEQRRAQQLGELAV